MAAQFKLQKRLAAQVLDVGENRIILAPARLQDIKDAITKQDIRELVKEGAISAKPIKGISKSRFRKRLTQKRKGRRKGTGKLKGKRISKRLGKQVWVKRVRALRKILKLNKLNIKKEDYRRLRKVIKAGNFKTKSQLNDNIQSLIKKK